MHPTKPPKKQRKEEVYNRNVKQETLTKEQFDQLLKASKVKSVKKPEKAKDKANK